MFFFSESFIVLGLLEHTALTFGGQGPYCPPCLQQVASETHSVTLAAACHKDEGSKMVVTRERLKFTEIYQLLHQALHCVLQVFY